MLRDFDFYAPYDPPVPPPAASIDIGVPGPVRPIAWDRFTKDVLELYGDTVRAPATRRAMGYALASMPPLGVETTADLTVGLIARFVDSLPGDLSANTVRSRLRTIAVFCTFAFKWGYVRISPFAVRSVGSWVRPSPTQGQKHHSRADIARVLAEMARQAETLTTGWEGWRARRLYGLTSTLAYCGLRANEAYCLQVHDLDLDRHILHVTARPENRLKTVASSATVPLAPPLVPIIRNWLEHRMDHPRAFEVDTDCPWVFPTLDRRHPWTSGAPGTKPRHRMMAVAASIGVYGFHPLSLRHSLATHLVAAGAGQAGIRRMLRHTNNQTQEFYLHDDLDDMRALVARIEF